MKLVKTKVFSKVIGEKCHENRLLIYLFTFLRGYIYLFRVIIKNIEVIATVLVKSKYRDATKGYYLNITFLSRPSKNLKASYTTHYVSTKIIIS